MLHITRKGVTNGNIQNLWVGKYDYVILESAWKPEPHEMELLRKSREFADFITLEDRA